MPSPDKNALRKSLRSARRSLSVQYRQQAAARALRHLLNKGVLLKGRRWGFYLPLGEEFDALPLVNQALNMGKRCYLPVTANRVAQPLKFAELDGKHGLTHNRYGIIEPHSRRLLNARWLDVLIMPLVGFDKHGQRLGMGGGYYDATLAYLNTRKRWRRPYLIGLAFECQRVAEIPAERWDVRLDAVLTENGLMRFADPSGLDAGRTSV
jgi:5-formyltetrahydrofolate cyclo-ligase